MCCHLFPALRCAALWCGANSIYNPARATPVGGLGRKKRHQSPTASAAADIDDGLDDAPTPDVTVAASMQSDSDVGAPSQSNSKQADLVPKAKVRKQAKKKKKKKKQQQQQQQQQAQASPQQQPRQTMVRKITLPPRKRSKGRGIKVTAPMEGKVAPPVVIQVDSKANRSRVADTKVEAKSLSVSKAGDSGRVRPQGKRKARSSNNTANVKQDQVCRVVNEYTWGCDGCC